MSDNKIVPNRIYVRFGSAKPANGQLLANELGYHTRGGILYIGQSDMKDPLPVITFHEIADAEDTTGAHVRVGLLQN